MLLAFVLLGRAVEERAKLQATSDMTALLNLLPPKARLLVTGKDGKEKTLDVPTDALGVGDTVLVYPGVSSPNIPVCFALFRFSSGKFIWVYEEVRFGGCSRR